MHQHTEPHLKKTRALRQRKSQQRELIQAVFRQQERPLAVAEVLQFAQHNLPGIGIATVYRNINALVAEGWLNSVDLPNEAPRYELAKLKHHHHFHCQNCGLLFDIPGCSMHLEDHVPQGFHVVKHEVILYGTCASCG